MKLITFEIEEARRVGALLANDDILDFAHPAAGIVDDSERNVDHLAWFDLDGALFAKAARLAARAANEANALTALRAAGAVIDRATVRVLAPIPRPGKVICIGKNYREHAAESGSEAPARPLMFSKFPTSIVGSGDTVVIPPLTERVDYEAELAVVIGRRGVRIAVEDALDHVLGYANFNDVSARDFQFSDGQWQRGKSPDTFGPFGEYVATKDEITDPHALRIRFRLNGETLQDATTADMVHDVPHLIAALSETVTLEPGDVIATGTPAGVGFARKPPVWVKPGDVMEVEIDGLGVLRNPVASYLG